MGSDIPKQYLTLAGQSVLQHSVSAFLQHRGIRHVFVVVSPDDGYVAADVQPDPRLTVLFCGGATRAESVSNGLAAMAEDVSGGEGVNATDWVLVHDAARPGISQELITRLLTSIGEDDVGGLLALPVVDTVKLKSASTLSTISRNGLWLAQTPQMFRHAPLKQALALAQAEDPAAVTDEASAMERLGLVPRLVEGHWGNAKITLPGDLLMVAAYLSAR